MFFRVKVGFRSLGFTCSSLRPGGVAAGQLQKGSHVQGWGFKALWGGGGVGFRGFMVSGLGWRCTAGSDSACSATGFGQKFVSAAVVGQSPIKVLRLLPIPLTTALNQSFPQQLTLSNSTTSHPQNAAFNPLNLCDLSVCHNKNKIVTESTCI